MSAQYRAEFAKLVDKYCRTFGVLVSQVAHAWRPGGEDFIWCPERPELPAWGMGAGEQDWKDGPTQDLPRWATRPPKTVLVSRRKR